MSSAPLAQHYCVEKPSLMDKQNIIVKYDGKFAKGAG
jgi:hypothetical protein